MAELALSKQDLKLVSRLRRMGNLVENAEREVRDITKDRDHWRARAREAEALLKSHGINTLVSGMTEASNG